ncbi:hypothetical protein [uncultured Tateyamaria sp.]|uniref:hypothetical protein n=1 Tax=uncultured Tateyamaria sp. TaxID=455651 RepID=UPI00261711A2|nr:hypothetical protein [uncultured Tateyamaria sp.]
MSDQDLAELDKMIAKARQKPLAYGLCLGKKPEDNVLYLDLKKAPEVMMRKAKADGETGKVTCGEAEVKGKILTLTVMGKTLPGLAKNMKAFMSKQGMKMKIIIADPDGNVLESDGDEDLGDEVGVGEAAPADEIAEQDAAEEPVADDPMAGQWAKVSAALTPLVDRFVAAGSDKAAPVSAAWQKAHDAAAKGDYKSALAAAAKIKPLVTAAPAQQASTPDDPNKAKWDAVQGPLEGLYTSAMDKNPENRTKLQAAWAMALEKAEAGDYTTALTIAGKLKPLLDAAASAEQSGQEAEIPADVVPFQKSRVLWIDSRKKMFEEMKKLENAIIATCKGDPELEPIAAEASDLTGRLTVFDETLQDMLDQITNTPSGPNREGLKKQALGTLKSYAAALNEPFFKDVDGNNGFVNVSVASTARASLASIAKVLAA